MSPKNNVECMNHEIAANSAAKPASDMAVARKKASARFMGRSSYR